MSNSKVLIKNMVCPRCITTVADIFQSLGIAVTDVALGEVSVPVPLTVPQTQELQLRLNASGFELIETRINKIIDDIRRSIAAYLSEAGKGEKVNLSAYITARIPYDYSYLSDLFSGIEGKSIEQYFIEFRIEKVKELIVYDELSLTEIAFRTGFSSVHHLSAQFKKVTGLTPSHFRTVGAARRKPLDRI